MTVLSDTEIKRCVEASQLISPFETGLLQGASYDMRLGKQYVKDGQSHSLEHGRRSIELAPGEFALISTLEILKLPLNIVGRNGLMSPWARRGLVSIFSPQIDPGFEGVLFVPVFNAGDSPISITHEEPFCTVEFVLTTRPATFSWAERHGKQATISSRTPTPTVSRPNSVELTDLQQKHSGINAKVASLEANITKLTDQFALLKDQHESNLKMSGMQISKQSRDYGKKALHIAVATLLLTLAALIDWGKTVENLQKIWASVSSGGGSAPKDSPAQSPKSAADKSGK